MTSQPNGFPFALEFMPFVPGENPFTPDLMNSALNKNPFGSGFMMFVPDENPFVRELMNSTLDENPFVPKFKRSVLNENPFSARLMNSSVDLLPFVTEFMKFRTKLMNSAMEFMMNVPVRHEFVLGTVQELDDRLLRPDASGLAMTQGQCSR